jgi:hypothetical protein
MQSFPTYYLIKHNAMKKYGGMDVQIQVFLSSALVGSEWLASRPGSLTPGEGAPGAHWIGGWLGPRRGKEETLTLPGLKLQLLGRPARSPSLYRLRYPGSRI